MMLRTSRHYKNRQLFLFFSMHVSISVKQVDILLVDQLNQNKGNINEYQRLYKQKGVLERYHKFITFLDKTGIKPIYAAIINVGYF